MAKLQIDLSGKLGLTNDYYGDMDQTISLNNRNFITNQGEMVDGYFNPFMRRGFLSPSVGTMATLTTSLGSGATLTSVVYDSINSVSYWGEKGVSIAKLDGVDDTSFATVYSLTGTNAPTITDLEIYQINGVRTLFASFTRLADTFTVNASTNVFTWTNASIANGTAVTFTNFGGALPSGISAGTTYYIVNRSGFTGQVAATLGGSAIDITTTGSGTNTVHGGLGDAFTQLLSAGTQSEVGFTNATNGINLSSNFPFMRVADNGFMYIFDGYVVSKFDGTINGGTNGTISNGALLFPPYFTVTDAVDYRGNLYMVVHETTVDTSQIILSNFSNQCGIYIWDRQTTVANMSDFIPLEGVQRIQKIYIAPNGALRIITLGSNRLTQIRQYNGNSFDIVREMGIGAFPQYHDSITNAGNLTIWGGMDGNVYAYGPVDPTTTYAYASVAAAKSEALAKIGQLKVPATDPGSTLTNMGAIFYGAGNAYSGISGYRTDRQGITMSYNDGSLELKKLYPFDKGTINSVQQNALAGNIFTGVVPMPYASTIHAINLIQATGTATGATTQATLNIYFNGSATPWASKVITRDDIARGFKRIYVGKPWVQSIQFGIVYPTGTTLDDTSDFHPLMAEVLYDPMPLLDKNQT